MINRLWLSLLLGAGATLLALTVPRAKAHIPEMISPDVAELLAMVAEIESTRGTEAVREWLEARIVADQSESSSVRERAVDELALRGGPNAVAHLRELAPRAGSMSSRLYQRSWEALAAQEADEDMKLLVLLDALEGGSPEASLPVRRWAAEELCSRGVEAAWEPLMAYFQRYRGQESRLQCVRQMAILRECGGDRLRAMAEVLRRQDPRPDQPLHRWAFEVLTEDRSPEADALLLEHALRLQTSEWLASQNVAALLKSKGWSEEELTARGIEFVPPWFRNPPRPPRDRRQP